MITDLHETVRCVTHLTACPTRSLVLSALLTSPARQVLSYVRFGLISAKTLAEAVEQHPLVQSKSGTAFLHEAYRFQALPPESQEEFASSMATRARPRAVSITVSSVSFGGRRGKRKGRPSDASRGHELLGRLGDFMSEGREFLGEESEDEGYCWGADRGCEPASTASAEGQEEQVAPSSCESMKVCQEDREEKVEKWMYEGKMSTKLPVKSPTKAPAAETELRKPSLLYV